MTELTFANFHDHIKVVDSMLPSHSGKTGMKLYDTEVGHDGIGILIFKDELHAFVYFGINALKYELKIPVYINVACNNKPIFWIKIFSDDCGVPGWTIIHEPPAVVKDKSKNKEYYSATIYENKHDEFTIENLEHIIHHTSIANQTILPGSGFIFKTKNSTEEKQGEVVKIKPTDIEADHQTLVLIYGSASSPQTFRERAGRLVESLNGPDSMKATIITVNGSELHRGLYWDHPSKDTEVPDLSLVKAKFVSVIEVRHGSS